MGFDLNLLIGPAPALLFGFAVTLAVTILTFVVAAILGTALAIASFSNSKPVSRVAVSTAYVARATPELIAIFWAYYCLPIVIGARFSGFTCGVLALGVIGSGYMAQIIRGGILAVPLGQWEAARSLGLARFAIWLRVILPQAIRKMLPALVNFLTDVLKNSTLLAGIGVGEVAYAAYLAGSSTYRYLEPLTGVAILFFALIFPLSLFARHLGRRESAVTKSM